MVSTDPVWYYFPPWMLWQNRGMWSSSSFTKRVYIPCICIKNPSIRLKAFRIDQENSAWPKWVNFQDICNHHVDLCLPVYEIHLYQECHWVMLYVHVYPGTQGLTWERYAQACRAPTHSHTLPVTQWAQGAVSIRKTVLPGMAIPMLKIRRPNGRLIFNMEIAIRR